MADHYMNPFDFVPLPGDGPKPLLESFREGANLEGYLTYNIEVKTPLHITGKITRKGSGEFNKKSFYKNYGKKVIPGASVRGMLAAYIEALTGSDLAIYTRGDEKSKSGPPYAKTFKSRHVGFLVASPKHTLDAKKERLPKRKKLKYERSNTLPPGFGQGVVEDAARHLFGYVDADEKKNENPAIEEGVKKPPAQMGKLVFEDIVVPENIKFETYPAWDLKTDAIMGGPNPRANTAWYFTPGKKEESRKRRVRNFVVWEILADKIRGRKFYYHQHIHKCHEKYEEWKRWNKDLVEYDVKAVTPGKDGKATLIPGGRIYFTGLTKPLLEFLVYAIALEKDQAHKLGGLKPFGFGSVKLHVDGLFYRDMQNPLKPIESQGLKVYRNYDLIFEPAYAKLKTIMHFPGKTERDDFVFVYPVYNQSGYSTEKKGFAFPESVGKNDPFDRAKAKKITLFFNKYQEKAKNHDAVMKR